MKNDIVLKIPYPRLPFGNEAEAHDLANRHMLRFGELMAAGKELVARTRQDIPCTIVRLIAAASAALTINNGLIATMALAYVIGTIAHLFQRVGLIEHALAPAEDTRESAYLKSHFSIVRRALLNRGLRVPGKVITLRLPRPQGPAAR